jgi:hypothetical protein
VRYTLQVIVGITAGRVLALLLKLPVAGSLALLGRLPRSPRQEIRQPGLAPKSSDQLPGAVFTIITIIYQT